MYVYKPLPDQLCSSCTEAASCKYRSPKREKCSLYHQRAKYIEGNLMVQIRNWMQMEDMAYDQGVQIKDWT